MKKFFHKFHQAYKNSRLQTKFTLVLVAAVTVPMLLLYIFFYGRLYDMVTADTIRKEQTASAATAPAIEKSLQKVLDTYDQMTELPFYKELFHQPVKAPFQELLSSGHAREFQEKVNDLISRSPVSSIRIYADFDSSAPIFESESTKNLFVPMSVARGTYWYGIFQGTSYPSLHCPAFYLGTKETKELGDMAYIVSSSIYYEGESYPCYTALYYSSQMFQDILLENLASTGSVSYIINERNALVTTSDASLSGMYRLDYQTIQDSFMSSNNFIEKSVLEEKVYAGFYSITQPQWYLVTILPSAPLVEKSKLIMSQTAFLYLGCLVFAFFFANKLVRSLTRRLSSVIQQMKLVKKGPPVPMAEPHVHDEVGDLIDTYNYMTRKMNQLMEKQAQAAEDLRIAEFNSLQAQINPHFLYNTMDMINWLSQQGRTSEVSNAVQNLSRFYKLTLSRKQNISTIAQEEEHVSIYIRLQNMRYPHMIDFVSDIPDELMDYPIPKLTLQPVVENAVLHGILEKESRTGTIVLTGWLEGSDIVLLVSDDGVGIGPATLKTILSGDTAGSSKGTNIAVYNTHRRLQILYGPKYGLTYSSQVGKGTEVQIRFPVCKSTKSPLLPAFQGLAQKNLLPLVMVSDKQENPVLSTVSPRTLLEYSQKLTSNTYVLQDLHKVSSELPRDENIYILSHQVTGDFPAHTHDYFELNYLCSGALINVVDGSELYMTPGDLVILNQKAIQELIYQEPNTLLLNFCLFPGLFQGSLAAFYESGSALAAFFKEAPNSPKNYLYFSLGQNLKAQSCLTSILQEYADQDFHQTFSLEALFLMLFDHLTQSEEYSCQGTDKKTYEMVRFIKEHCITQTPQQIAAYFCLSLPQLEEALKRHTGRSLKSILEEARLDHSLTLLADPEQSVFQISQACGFVNADEFFSQFRKKFHLSPTEYRKQLL